MSGQVSAPLIVGFRFVLANEDLVSHLKSLEIERVTYEPAVIWDPKRRIELTTHNRLRVGQYFEADQINDLDLDGHRLLVMGDSYLFVSPSLKRALDKEGFDYLRFNEGLTQFAG